MMNYSDNVITRGWRGVGLARRRRSELQEALAQGIIESILAALYKRHQIVLEVREKRHQILALRVNVISRSGPSCVRNLTCIQKFPG